MLYSLTDLFGKIAAGFDLADWRFWGFYALVIGVLGVYALGWQQVIKTLAPYHSVFVEGDHGFLGFGVGCFVLP